LPPALSGHNQQRDKRDQVKQDDADFEKQHAGEVYRIELVARYVKPAAPPPSQSRVHAESKQSPQKQHSKINDRTPDKCVSRHFDAHRRSPLKYETLPFKKYAAGIASS
jgi:hypothetical protein